jgi:hypothetical protein
MKRIGFYRIDAARQRFASIGDAGLLRRIVAPDVSYARPADSREAYQAGFEQKGD